MNPLSCFLFCIAASVLLTNVPPAADAQLGGDQDANVADKSSGTDAGSLQQKATEAQVRIRANKDDRDQLMRAIKTNELQSARQVLLRNGFTAEDVNNAKITLQSGGGKGGKDEIEIFATCCNPKEITIRRSLDYFTK